MKIFPGSSDTHYTFLKKGIYVRAKGRLNNNNKMKKLFRLALVSSLSLMCFSCYYDELYIEEIPEIPEDQIVSFQDDIQPIFTANCISCHNATIANPDLREGNSYNAIVPDYVIAGDAENSELYQKLPGNNHPIETGSPLDVEEIALIKGWIDQGAENN